MTNILAIVLVGPALLAVFRRAARRASFDAPVIFEGESDPEPAMR